MTFELGRRELKTGLRRAWLLRMSGTDPARGARQLPSDELAHPTGSVRLQPEVQRAQFGAEKPTPGSASDRLGPTGQDWSRFGDRRTADQRSAPLISAILALKPCAGNGRLHK